MFFESFDGCKIWYSVTGTGKPIIFIPGLASDSTTWLQQLPFFEKDHQVILVDNRGCGESDSPQGDYSVDDMAKDILGLMDHLQIEKADIVGGSMGSMIATKLALHHPDRIDNLVLLTPFIKFNSRNRYWLKVMAMAAEKMSFEEYFAVVIVSSFGLDAYADQAKIAEMCKYFIKADHPPPAHGYYGQVAACLAFDATNDYQKIISRTLVIAAEDDFFVPVRDVKEIAGNIAEADFILMHDTGHTAQIQAPDKLNQIIAGFLSAETHTLD